MFEYLLGRSEISKEGVEDVIQLALKFERYQTIEKILYPISIDFDPISSKILSDIKNNEVITHKKR